MEKKISFITLVLVIILALTVGIGVGYIITKSIINDNIVQGVSNKNIKEQSQIEKELENSKEVLSDVKTNSNSTSVEETPNYDGNKNIMVSGKTYNISYKNESNPEENEKFNTTIYLNDKKLKTFEYHYKFNNDNLDVTTIKGDKEYIVISVRTYAASDDNVYLMIVNQEEEIIETVQVHECNIGISIDDIYSHKINDNNIIFFKMLNPSPKTKDGSKYSVAVYKITVEKDEVIYKLERLSTDEEVTFSGK